MGSRAVFLPLVDGVVGGVGTPAPGITDQCWRPRLRNSGDLSGRPPSGCTVSEPEQCPPPTPPGVEKEPNQPSRQNSQLSRSVVSQHWTALSMSRRITCLFTCYQGRLNSCVTRRSSRRAPASHLVFRAWCSLPCSPCQAPEFCARLL